MESYAILGWGVSGRAAYRYLTRQRHAGIRIYLPQAEYRRAREEDESLPLVLSSEDIREEVLVRSPGIRPDTPAILRAMAGGAHMTSELRLFSEACPAPVYAVTGSDGKTTTATLAARMLEAAGETTHLGGNIGLSLLDRVDMIQPTDRVVLEVSSFQLMDFIPAYEAAAFTNISENHLNWHTDMAEYRRAKEHVLLHARRRVCNARLASPLSAVTFSATVSGASYHLSHDVLMHGDEPILPASAVKLRGVHNLENILCAAALTRLPATVVKSVAATFEGVAHRMMYCGTYHGVTCYDSSIDTTPARTAATLAALPQGCTVLAGGAGKRLSYTPLAAALARHAAHVVFTGEAGEEMQAALVAYADAHPTCRVTHLFVSDFSSAVDAALLGTPQGGTLVLSPAATSFDAFTSYRERGDAFRACLARHT